MSAFWAAFLSTTAIDLIELGSIVFIAAKLWSERTEVRLVSFAAGVLLSTVFLDLLPEAVKQAPHEPSNLFTGTLLAMLALFLIERTLGREHSHDPETRQHQTYPHPTPSRGSGGGINSSRPSPSRSAGPSSRSQAACPAAGRLPRECCAPGCS